MADNTTLNSGVGGDVVRDIDRSGVKTQVVQVDLGGASAESLLVSVAKGTQGATAVPTQDLKDSGRVIFSAAVVIAGVTGIVAATLVPMVPERNGTAGSSASTFTVTSGKKLRITNMVVGFANTSTAIITSRICIVMNPTTTPTASSPVVVMVPLSLQFSTGIAQEGNVQYINFPEGIEFSGTNQFAVVQSCSATSCTIWVSLLGYEY